MARKSKYEECVKPHIEKIRDWVAAGATIDEIAEGLGIAPSTLYDYKNKHAELSEAFSHGRKEVIVEIKAALLRKALGFHYEETRNSLRTDDNGKEVIFSETVQKYCVPSETAAAMLLRNYSDDWRDSDSATLKMKQNAERLKKRIAEANNFLDDE